MASVHFLYFDLQTGYYPSLHQGLASLFGTLKQNGHHVTLDHLSDERQIGPAAAALRESRPDLIALSFTSNQIRWARDFFAGPDGRALRDRLIVAGGVHCTLAPQGTMEELPWLDGLCIGEGEEALSDLCRRIDAGGAIQDTPSFWIRTPSGIVRNAVLPLPKVEDLPHPDFTPFDHRRIVSQSGHSFPMLLSRGCPYDCHYCCNHALSEIGPEEGPPYTRILPVSKAIERIARNLELRPETRSIKFADDTFTLHRGWLIEFCEAYSSEIGLPFTCSTRVETINEEVVQALNRAGCVQIDFGVESGSEWLRRRSLGRRHGNDDLIRAFRMVQAAGIRCFAFNLVGVPFENEAMARETLELNLVLRPHYGKCSYFFPYPATRAQAMCEAHGLTLEASRRHSGYFEGPSIKPTHMPHRVMRRYFNRINFYLYYRLFLSRFPVPHRLETLTFRLLAALRVDALAMQLLTQVPRGRTMHRARRVVRRLALGVTARKTRGA